VDAGVLSSALTPTAHRSDERLLGMHPVGGVAVAGGGAGRAACALLSGDRRRGRVPRQRVHELQRGPVLGCDRDSGAGSRAAGVSGLAMSTRTPNGSAARPLNHHREADVEPDVASEAPPSIIGGRLWRCPAPADVLCAPSLCGESCGKVLTEASSPVPCGGLGDHPVQRGRSLASTACPCPATRLGEALRELALNREPLAAMAHATRRAGRALARYGPPAGSTWSTRWCSRRGKS
jgi:hypothetical protein